MAATLIDGKAISLEIIEGLKEAVANLTPKPGLAVILVGGDPASKVYVHHKEKACVKAGFYSEMVFLPEDTRIEEILQVIDRLNQDPKIHGILCQFPLPDALRQYEGEIINRISPEKDVDGFHPLSKLTPCTPKGIMQLLKTTGVSLSGNHAVVLGRSHMVGKPIARLLLDADATVTMTHSKTVDLDSITRQADVLIAAIGKPEFVTASMVKPGSVVIDVGINRTAEGIVGDVDFQEVTEIASFITPVPGGVGPMTIAMLLDNCFMAYQDQLKSG